MNSNSDSQNLTDFSEDTAASEAISIDEFFRQLEAKEKDLHISPEMIIEIEDDDEDNGLKTQEIMPLVAPPVKAESAVVPSVVPEESSMSRIELFNLRNEVSKLQIQLVRTENERAEMFESARRRHSDFENYKNRTERERTETFQNQLSHLASKMLPVLDNMNRALDSTKIISDKKTTEFQQFFEGIELVNLQLNEILAEMGIEPIAAVGESFDPHLHEAVATEVTDEINSNTVTEELMRGYRIGEKIIRPSMVKVSVSSNTGKLPEVLTLSERNLTDPESE